MCDGVLSGGVLTYISCSW